MWQVSAGQAVIIWRDEADAMLAIIEAYDGIPFVWHGRDGGNQFVLMPRPRGRVQ